MRHGNDLVPSVRLSVCPSVRRSVCLSVCNALTFESFVLDSLFLVCMYVFRTFRSSLKFVYQGHRVKVKVTACIRILLTGYMPSIEKKTLLLVSM